VSPQENLLLMYVEQCAAQPPDVVWIIVPRYATV
jgi:hypothetical protein